MPKSKILIIEDDVIIRENVSELLELSGFTVYNANDGIEGVKTAKQVKPDLILCDIMMPEMDGYGVLYTVSKDDNLAHIPFIFLTAKTGEEQVRKGINLGADDYLTKPFEASDLLTAIETRLKKSARIKETYTSNILGLKDFTEDIKETTNLESIIDESNHIVGKKNDCIYREGSHPREIYYILKGSVKKIILHEDGKELLIKVFKEGDFFGIIPVINNTEYTHSAITLEDYEIVSISIEDFNFLISSNSEIRNKFIKILAGNVQEKEFELLEIAYGTVRSRLAEGFLKLSDIYQESTQNGIPLSRLEVAQFIGVANETLIRTVSDFKKEGLITMNGKRIIPNIEKLKLLKY